MTSKTDVEIDRGEWVREMEERSPSPRAFETYLDLERFVVEETSLLPTYRRNKQGKSHHAAFNGSAGGRVSVIQIYDGGCYLIWKWKKPIPGVSDEQHAAVNEALERFRKNLGSKSSLSYEKVKVLSIGSERVKGAISNVAEDLADLI